VTVLTCDSLSLRNVLVYGPSGTGKSLIVKRVSELSGLECAVINGSDFGPLASFAVAEIHSLFTWAKRARRGQGIPAMPVFRDGTVMYGSWTGGVAGVVVIALM
jgi:hypothetical protein